MRQVLVVDDEVEITEGLVALFETEDIKARGAYDRASAEDLLQTEFFPVILADLRLGTSEEGLKLVETIRQKSPGSRIATMTGHATPELEAELKRLGSWAVLHKPIPFESILAVVSEMLEEIEREAALQEARTGHLDLAQLYQDTLKVLLAIPKRRYGFSPEESEELAQEAWCLYLQKRHAVRLPRPWLAATIANLCRQQIHRNMMSREVCRDIGVETEEIASPRDRSWDHSLMLRQALQRLDERSRKLCTLIGLEQWSYEEVASELGLPIGSIGPLYLRAKKKLRKALEFTH